MAADTSQNRVNVPHGSGGKGAYRSPRPAVSHVGAGIPDGPMEGKKTPGRRTFRVDAVLY